MKQVLSKVPLDSIAILRNVRLDALHPIANLADSIRQTGLNTPIVVHQGDYGGLPNRVLRGHLRVRSMLQVRDKYPDDFNKHFPDGEVPAIIVTQATPEEISELLVDHGNENPLKHPLELQFCANELFESGHTEDFVIHHLSTLMDRISPMKGDTRTKIEGFRKEMEIAERAGRLDEVEQLQREIRQRISQYRRGMVQNLHNTYRCPNIVMAALTYKATGVKPEGYEDTILPKVTSTEVTSLWNAFKDDLCILRDGIPVYTKENPGPNFNRRWEKLCDDTVAASKEDKPPRKKAMSAQSMLAEVNEGMWRSEGLVKLSQRHAGEEVTGLAAIDQNYRYADLLIKRDPECWEANIERAKELEEELREEIKTTEA